MRSQKEIEKVEKNLDTTKGSRFFSMTYEQGVENALKWVLGLMDTEEFVDENGELI